MFKTAPFAPVLLLAATVLSAAGSSAAEKTEPEQGMPLPRVLLIGDSICGGCADIAVREMRHFSEGNTAPDETCWCLEQQWFWSAGASPKTAQQVVDLLTSVNAKRSNLLLNVGPNKQGKFEEASVKILAEVGKPRDSGTPADPPR